MSALPVFPDAEPPVRELLPMAMRHLDAVFALETRVYAFPWTRGNFVDSLAAGHVMRVLVDPRGELIGYFVAMEGVDEVHLLNITVAPERQGRGHAVFMIDALVAVCRGLRCERLWLEVRETNHRARAIYERYGFAHVARRPAYYPASRDTHPSGREDAHVMKLDLVEGAQP